MKNLNKLYWLKQEVLQIENQIRELTILSAFETLTKTEQVILKLSFGFCDNKHFSLDEIAEVLDLTYERVRRIVAKALRKFNHPSRREAKACLEGLDCYKQLMDEAWS